MAEKHKKGIPRFSLKNLGFKVGVLAAIITILAFIPQIRAFFGWTQSLKYVELKGAFPNEKWLRASQEDYAWLVGEWNVRELGGFISSFELRNGKLFRQNRSTDNFYAEDNFVSEWYSIEVHKSQDGVLRLAYAKESEWPLNFVQKEDNCVCYESERYIAEDGKLRSGRARQMLNIEHTKLSRDGMTYVCY